MVDHHLRPITRVAGIHGVRDGGPVGLRGVDVAVGAGAVPGVDLVGGRYEAAGGHTGVDGGGGEKLGVGGGHDVLQCQS